MRRTLAVLLTGIVVSLLWDMGLLAGSGDAGPVSVNGWGIDLMGGEASSTEVKLLPADGGAAHSFGCSVSISGDYAIVGADRFDENGIRSGCAYVFKRSEDAWIQQAKLLASDGADWDYFGCSVSICGDYAIAGAVADDDRGSYSGSAYVFTRNGDAWIQQAKLLASDGAAGDSFGCSVSITGDYAIVGACADDEDGIFAGSAYVFERRGDTWIQQAKLVSSDRAPRDNFGGSVSVSGDYAIVGAFGDDDKGSNSGSAYVFKRSGDTWTQRAKLLASDGVPADNFGCSVSINGDWAIVGAFGDDDEGSNCGSAYVFKWSGNTWTQQGKLLASDGGAEDWFGAWVSISGDYAIAGAPKDDDKGTASGSAYVFRISPPTFALTTSVHPPGAGSVSVDPQPGADGTYAAGTEVTLMATPGACYKFTGWSGDLSSLDDTATITMDGDKTVTANFARIAYTLTVTSGKGGSVVTPGEGSFSYDCGQSVMVEAEPADAWRHFVGWTGTAVDAGKVDSRNDPETTVLVDGDYTLHANFTCEQHTLRVSSTPGGSVCIMVIIDGIAQGWLGDRTLRFDHGTEIGLLAIPDPGYEFKNWSHTMWSTDDSLVFVLDEDHDLTANFAVPPAP